jgi:transcriptional regulator with XRE-family HTH domain
VSEKRIVTELEAAEGHEHARLSGLLKRCRARLGPECRSLGPYLRRPIRIGKAVTQEEVAEAAGISRVWYATLENDRRVRFSARTLGRIADALMMDPPERETLFRLAVPALRSASLAGTSTAILEAFGSLQRLMRRLWAATTEAEALTVVREHALTQLAPDGIQTLTRVAEGRWVRDTTGDRDLAKRYDAMIQGRWDAASIDDLCCHTLMVRPGEVLTRYERDTCFPDLAAKERPALDAIGLSDLSFAMANVRSQRGFAARLLVIHRTNHAFSNVERAQLSTLADLTSLALSG